MKMFIAVLLIASIGSIMGLKCYTCTYGAVGVNTNTEACNEPFDANGENVFSLDCSILGDTFDVCATTYGIVEGTYTAARTCFLSSICPSANGCVTANNATVCCCNTDNCNGDGGETGDGDGTGTGAVTVAFNIVATVAVVIAAMTFNV